MKINGKNVTHNLYVFVDWLINTSGFTTLELSGRHFIDVCGNLDFVGAVSGSESYQFRAEFLGRQNRSSPNAFVYSPERLYLHLDGDSEDDKRIYIAGHLEEIRQELSNRDYCLGAELDECVLKVPSQAQRFKDVLRKTA